MKLIWTKSNKLLSIFIRWGLNTDCSHFAIVFNSPAGGLLFESNLLGTHPKFYKNYKKHVTIVHEIDLNIDIETENLIWDKVVDEYDGKPYDYPAFIYFIFRAVLKKLFKIPFPKKNKWGRNDMFICDELYEIPYKNKISPDLKIDLAITPPHEVYEILQKLMEKKENG